MDAQTDNSAPSMTGLNKAVNKILQHLYIKRILP